MAENDYRNIFKAKTVKVNGYSQEIFCHFFFERDFFFDFLFVFHVSTPSDKGSTLKGKALFPWEQILSFRVDKEDKNIFDRITSLASVLLLLE